MDPERLQFGVAVYRHLMRALTCTMTALKMTKIVSLQKLLN